MSKKEFPVFYSDNRSIISFPLCGERQTVLFSSNQVKGPVNTLSESQEVLFRKDASYFLMDSYINYRNFLTTIRAEHTLLWVL